MIVNNLCITDEKCPLCQKRSVFSLQFRYGDVWAYDYQLGEIVRFSGGETDVGSPGHRRVVLYGLENRCDNCHAEGYFEAYIFLENDKICSYSPATGLYDFSNDEDFIVLEE